MLNETLKETDYSKFKLLKTNRRTTSGHISKLKISIREKDLTQDFPIIIDKDFYVIDGQHRLEALKLLGLPVYYRFAVFASSKDIKLLNSTAKSWNLEDHLNSYIQDGNINYIKLREFMSWAGIKAVNAGIKIVAKTGRKRLDSLNLYFDQTNKSRKLFIDGEFLYPDDDSNQRNFILKLRNLSQFTHHKDPFQRSFYVAIEKITEDELVDFDRLLSKLNQYPLGVYNDANSLIDQLEKAYNYNVGQDKKKFFNRVK